MRILMLSGGRSAEREVSIRSGRFVSTVLRGEGHDVIPMELDSDGTWSFSGSPTSIDTTRFPWVLRSEGRGIGFDLVFPVLHGPWGEDGTLQGLCRMAGWPCAGAGVLTSALAMNKAVSRKLVSGDGIPVLPWKRFVSSRPPVPEEISCLGYPLFVKPARMGSSVGISRVESPDQLDSALEEAFGYDSLIVIEKGMPDPREIEVSLLGEADGISASVPGEVVPGDEWYDYRAKYDCPDSRLVIPAEVDAHTSEQLREMACRVFSLLGGRGYARVDFLMDRQGGIYFNEMNTIPGFTSISMFSKLWEATGVSSGELLERIVREAVNGAAGAPAGGGSS